MGNEQKSVAVETISKYFRKRYKAEKAFTSRLKMWEYPILPPDVREVIDYTIRDFLKPNPVLRLKKEVLPKVDSLWFLEWSDIIMLREALSENDLEKTIEIVYGITGGRFNQLEIFNVYAAYLWIAKEFAAIMETEIEQLALDLDEEEKAAGAEELQRFTYVVALDGLAGGDLLKYDEYLRLPYTKIFRKLLLDKTRFEITRNMQRNASRTLTGNS